MRTLKPLAAAIVATTLAIMPLSLLGAISVEIRTEMGFTTSALGQLVAVYFLTFAVSSVPLGYLVERITPKRGLLFGGLGTAMALLGIAGLARAWWHLALLLALAGLSSAIVQPSANTLIARGAPPQRMGLVFGLKQSAVPFAGVVAGTMVPLVALTFGWRWAFVLCSLGTLVVILLSRGIRRDNGGVSQRTSATADAPNRLLVSLAIAFALGTAAAGSLTVFFVESSVAAGIPLSFAGTILSLASGFGVGTRLLVGWLADRRGRSQLPRISLMLCIGALGFIALASGNSQVYIVGALVAFGAGWGWPGLMNLTVVQMWSARPATSTGAAMAGMALGATVGPIVLGKIADDVSFGLMWIVVAILSLISAGLLLWIRRSSVRMGVGSHPDR